jgi:hypothetical protein
VGTVGELAKGSNSITTLASFNGTNGGEPSASVTFDANGNLYGTAASGGANSDRTVWELQASALGVPEPSSLVMGLVALVLVPLVLRRFF